MTSTVYALLVGINDYAGPVRRLRGCVNDVTHMQAFLEGRVAGNQLRLKILTNSAATRQAIIDGFQKHLRQATADDVVLFYYSGHGSQQHSPPEFWHLEPDRMDETLVCYDSRLPGNYDLADKELSTLIAELAITDPHIVVILDSCHSGSGTRAGDDEGVRHQPADDRQRPIETFLTSSLVDVTRTRLPQPSGATSDWITVPQGKHIVLSACRADEEAKELFLGEEHRGIFSYYMLETLQGAGETLTYPDLVRRVSARVGARVSIQSPLIEASDGVNLNQPFLGGTISHRKPYFTVSPSLSGAWVMDGGAIHGIAKTPDETTVLALFPANGVPDQLRRLDTAIGEARVTQVSPHQSSVDVSLRDNTQPNLATVYEGVVISLPVKKMGVHISGDETGVALARRALAEANDGEPSVYVREVSVDEAELQLLAVEQVFRIQRRSDSRRLVVDIPAYSMGSAITAIERVEHIARWTQTVELDNAHSKLPDDAVVMELVTGDGSSGAALPGNSSAERNSPRVRMEYEYRDGKWQPRPFRIKLTNTTNRRLYCGLLDLTQRYKVDAALIPNGDWIEPHGELWALAGKNLFASVPPEWTDAGVTEYRDIIKLIVSTEPFNPHLLEQGNLDVPVDRSANLRSMSRSTGQMSTLNRLMRRLQFRDVGGEQDADAYTDWRTSDITIIAVRPLASTALSAPSAAYLGHGVKIRPHSKLQGTLAKARLTTVPEAGRDVGNVGLPPILRDDPRRAYPFEFETGRSGLPGPSVVELLDVPDRTLITPDEPLIIDVNTMVTADESVIAIGHDGEFFLPLGYGKSTPNNTVEIAIERLPEPVTGARSLQSAIRIFFQKVVSERLKTIAERVGLHYDYPHLSVVDVAPDGTISPIVKQDQVASHVAQAQRIALYIHGIIGDTYGMARSSRYVELQVEPPLRLLAEDHDLVLTFDYENLKTSLEETARDLKVRLEAVGLHANDGKTLHIVAHSMGGLVARWFIEREGGRDIVDHLIMLGTPNNGSPWPKVQQWGTIAVGLALNSLTAVAWPLAVLGNALAAIEKIDDTLDQMEPGSQFLKTLAASADPGVSYTIIAGNTSIRPDVFDPDGTNGESVFTRFIKRLSFQDALYTVTAPVFFKQPNDIAVSISSMGYLPKERSPQPIVQEVACDHLTYFSTEAGLRALAAAVVADT